MNEEEFNREVDKTKFQVFIFTSTLPIPLTFAVHPWIVTNKKGEIKRWEVWSEKNKAKVSWGHVNLNLLKNPWIGLKKNSLKYDKWLNSGTHFESSLVKKLEGNLAKEMITFIEREVPDYKYKDEYHYYPGPNSNTFVQWVINKFPKSKAKLPFRAFGKNYK